MLSVMFAGLTTIPVKVTSQVPEEFDVQIVLGGDTYERSRMSYLLWKQMPGPLIVTGDLGYTIRELRDLGIPKSQIVHEPLAQTTFENAALTLPLLRGMGASRVVVVTSGYHSARALSCFRETGPDFEFFVCNEPRQNRPFYRSLKLRFQERIKRLAYAVKYGISPYS